jgi:hypothetical protein
MKSHVKSLAAGLLALGLLTGSLAAQAADGMKVGNPGLKSIGPLAFAPDGVLLAGDTASASVFAIATGDTTPAAAGKRLAVEGIDAKVAALLGTTPAEIAINDIAINPVSHQAYLAVSRGRSADALPVLVRVKLDGTLEQVALDSVRYSKVDLTNAPAAPAPAAVAPAPAGRGRGPSQRAQSITDLGYADGKVIIAGLSNEEFASTLRMVNYPFSGNVASTGVEIYHGSHGQFETNAPIRTFTTINLGNKSRLLAAYTCTPLVDLAMSQLTPGAKVRGKTIAELGNGNQPIDMFVYQKEGKNFLLMANSSRGVMKVGIDGIDATTTITAQVPERKFDGLTVDLLADWKDVTHLDKFDNAYAVVLQGKTAGSMNLQTVGLP